MDITHKLHVSNRGDWRAWLAANHDIAKETWLVFDSSSGKAGITYLDAVEEALCFGWIDSTAKRISDRETAQRFSPRRRGSNWTELNKERARRLIRLGLMTESGRRALPDLTTPFLIAEDILGAINDDPHANVQWESFPPLYLRIRIGYIEETRKNKAEFAKRLSHFIRKTAEGEMFGNWNDKGRLFPDQTPKAT